MSFKSEIGEFILLNNGNILFAIVMIIYNLIEPSKFNITIMVLIIIATIFNFTGLGEHKKK